VSRAVFFDRDGVLNQIVWRDGKAASPRQLDELVIESGAPAALDQLRAAGFKLFVVTNQPDVRRGLMPKAALDDIHRALREALHVDDVAVCEHDNADDCACRKPRPGMLLDLARRHDVDLSASIMVGDQDRDIACGQAAGCATVLLARPYNSGTGADHVVETLFQAMSVIMDAEPIPASARP